MEALEQKPVDDAPDIAAPEIATPEPAPADDLEELLAEFDRANQPAPDSSEQPAAPDSVDSFLKDLDGDKTRATALEGELNSLRAAEYQRVEREAFDKFSSELQSRLPEYCAPDSARNALLAAASERPELGQAWQYRNLSIDQRRAADSEYKRLEQLYSQVQAAPPDDRKQSALNQIEARAYQLSLMIGGQSMIRAVERDIEHRFREYKPIDREATLDRNLVAQAVRDAHAPVGRDPPPAFGTMSDNELRQYTKKNFGFV